MHIYLTNNIRILAIYVCVVFLWKTLTDRDLDTDNDSREIEYPE